MSESKDEPKQELNPATQFRQLYDQEYLSVYRSIRAVVLDAAAAEDLTQETFVRAYRARDRYTPTAPPGAWLRRIGINLAISHLRRQKLARFLPARLYIAPDRRDYDRAEARDVVDQGADRPEPQAAGGGDPPLLRRPDPRGDRLRARACRPARSPPGSPKRWRS